MTTYGLENPPKLTHSSPFALVKVVCPQSIVNFLEDGALEWQIQAIRRCSLSGDAACPHLLLRATRSSIALFVQQQGYKIQNNLECQLKLAPRSNKRGFHTPQRDEHSRS